MQSNETTFSRAHCEHRQLLINVKQTIESLFLNRATSSHQPTTSSSPSLTTDGLLLLSSTVDELGDNVLLRLHSAIEVIFINGLRIYKPDVSFIAFLCFFFKLKLCAFYFCRDHLIVGLS